VVGELSGGTGEVDVRRVRQVAADLAPRGAHRGAEDLVRPRLRPLVVAGEGEEVLSRPHLVEPVLPRRPERVLVVGGEAELDVLHILDHLEERLLRLAELRGRVVAVARHRAVAARAEVVADAGVELRLRALRRPVHRARGVEDHEDVRAVDARLEQVAVVGAGGGAGEGDERERRRERERQQPAGAGGKKGAVHGDLLHGVSRGCVSSGSSGPGAAARSDRIRPGGWARSAGTRGSG